MDVPTLIREIKALPPADKHAILDAIEEDLAPRIGGFIKDDDNVRFLDHLPGWRRCADSRNTLG